MNTKDSRLNTRKCSDCGGDVFLYSKKTEIVEGQYSPVTTYLYHCKDQSCQENKEKKATQRIKLLKDQETAKQNRLKNIRLRRKKNLFENNRKRKILRHFF